MEEKRDKNFVYGEKVVFLPDGRTYDFGYLGQTGKAIIYEEGECNMQDASAVSLEDLVRASEFRR